MFSFLRHGVGRTVNPDSYFLRFPEKPDARIIALSALIQRAESPVARFAGEELGIVARPAGMAGEALTAQTAFKELEGPRIKA